MIKGDASRPQNFGSGLTPLLKASHTFQRSWYPTAKSGRREPCGSRPPTPPDLRFRDSKEMEAENHVAAFDRQLTDLRGRKDKLDEAFISKSAIDQTTYERQRDELNRRSPRQKLPLTMPNCPNWTLRQSSISHSTFC